MRASLVPWLVCTAVACGAFVWSTRRAAAPEARVAPGEPPGDAGDTETNETEGEATASALVGEVAPPRSPVDVARPLLAPSRPHRDTSRAAFALDAKPRPVPAPLFAEEPEMPERSTEDTPSKRMVDGWCQYLRRDGSVREEGSYSSSGREGYWTRYHANGTRAESAEYRQGRRAGSFRAWHPSGVLRSEGSYVAGEAAGHWRSWHPNGERASQGLYDGGRRTHAWSFWNENGELDRGRSGRYSEGVRVEDP